MIVTSNALISINGNTHRVGQKESDRYFKDYTIVITLNIL